ncbi:5-bromo-4-chloroindolyl phosphate hydrolysis family protein [Labrys neptuniae]
MEGGNHLIAGVAAAGVIPLGVFGLNLPVLAVVPLAALLYGGIVLVLAPRRAVERIDADKVGRAQAELVGSLVEEGQASVRRLEAAAAGLSKPTTRQSVSHLAQTAQGILDKLVSEPGKLAAVRRFLTYYLPRSVEIAEGLGLAEKQRGWNTARQSETEAILVKLDQAFGFYADSLSQAELDALDVELKLMSRALAEDIGGDERPSQPVQRKGP